MKNKTWSLANTTIKKIFYLPLYYLISLVLMLVGTLMSYPILALVNHSSFVGNAAFVTGEAYAVFIGIWIIVLLFFLIPSNRKQFTKIKKSEGNTLKNLGIGILIGFGMNAFCALCALLVGDIHLYFDSFYPISFILIFICVFIQSSAEELICRVYLYQKLRHAYKSPYVAIIGNALFFGLLHLGNEGVGVVPIVNIVLIGLLFSLIIYYFDSSWCVFAIHTAWNFTQNILLGLPNSGIVVPYSVFKLSAANARITFFYDPYFGIEGSWLSCVVIAIVIIVVIKLAKKKNAKTENMWLETSEK